MRDLPISNARYFQRAVITEVVPPAHGGRPRWNPYTTRARHESSGLAVAFSRDGRMVASSDAGGQLSVHRMGELATSPSQLLSLTWEDTAWTELLFSPDGDRLALLAGDGRVVEVEVATGIHRPMFEEAAHPGLGLAYTATGDLVAAFGTGELEVRSATDEAVLTTVPDLGVVHGRICLFGSGMVVVTGQDSVTTQWDIATATGTTLFHTGPINTIAVSTDGTRLVLGRADEAHVWDLATTGYRGWMSAPGQGEITDVALRPDGAQATLVCGGMLSVCDMDTRRVLRSTAETADIRAAAVAPDGILAAAGGDGQVTVIYDMDAGVAAPLSLPAPGEISDTARPAIGVLLTHEQSWTMQGVALGELLHTVSLAPGEVTQVAVSSHVHSVVQGSTDVAAQSEALDQSGASASNLAESEKSQASERSAGASAAMSASASSEAGVGGLAGLFGATGGTSTHAATGLQASFSSGSRNVSDQSCQDVHQASTEQARLQRQRHSASVREVSEGDALELQTRVVANYNHMHAMTLQYYEAVEIQQLRTKVVDAHRLLFVPLTPIDFTSPEQLAAVLADHRRPLVAAAQALGLSDAVAAVDLLALGDDDQGRRTNRITAVWEREIAADKALETITKTLGTSLENAADARTALLVARDELRGATDPGLARRDALQHAVQGCLDEQRTAAAGVVAARRATAQLRAARDAAHGDRIRLERVLRAVGAITGEPDERDEDAPPEPLAPPAIDVEALDAVDQEVRAVLARHTLALNQALWMRIDPGTWATLLAGHTFRGDQLGIQVDPTPVAVAGNRLGFRWHHEDPEEARAFLQAHVDDVEPLLDSLAMPTGGLFGEAVLGDANAAEKTDITRFWKWTDSLPPLRPTQIAPLAQPTPDEELSDMPTLGDVPANHTQLGPITFPQVASGIPAVTAALSNQDLFKDMSGTAASAALAQSAMEHTAAGASEAADLASQNFARHLKFQQSVAKVAMDHLRETAESGTPGTLDPSMAGAVLNARDDAAGDDGTGVTESHDLARPSSEPTDTGAASGDRTTEAVGRTIADHGGAGPVAPSDTNIDTSPSAEFVTDEP